MLFTQSKKHLLLIVAIFSTALVSQAFGQPAETPTYREVNDAKSVLRATSLFNSYLAKLGMKPHVSHCSRLLTAHLGTVEDIYVGECRLTNGHDLVLCADTAVGEFALSYNLRPDDIERFAKANCPGG